MLLRLSRAAVLIIAVTVCWTVSTASQPETSRFFPMAVWYGGGKARAPMVESDARAKKELWREDLRAIKATGFNTVRAWIDWASGQPAENAYDFQTIDVLLELAEEEGLKLALQVYMDSAPFWVGQKYPDSLFVSSNGQAIKPESAPGYCRDHPAVRAADNAFYAALARRVKDKPAFIGWDLWSEPHVINWANPTWIPNPEFCFCTNTVRRYREWLRKKYGSIESLNAAWYRRFTSWEDVEPSRMSTILSYTDYIDWKTFIAAKLGEDLRDRYQAVKSIAPRTIVTSHAAGVGLFASPHHWEGQSDDWTMARQVDFYGTSFYPKHSASVDRDVPWRAALLDFTRSFGYDEGRQGFWVGELQGGFGTIALNVSPTVTSDDLTVWTWSALSRAAKGINYYAWYPMSSGYESGGFGLNQLDGTITDRAKAAGAIAQLVDRHQDLFLDARPPRAEVAVIYNPLSHFVGGRQRAAAYGGPQGEVAGIERDSLLGVHRALFSVNVPLDYVHINAVVGREAPSVQAGVLPVSADASGASRRCARGVCGCRRSAGRRGQARVEQRTRQRRRAHPRSRDVRSDGRTRNRNRDGSRWPHVDEVVRHRPARSRRRDTLTGAMVQGNARTGRSGGARGGAVRRWCCGRRDVHSRQGAHSDAWLLRQRGGAVHADAGSGRFLFRAGGLGWSRAADTSDRITARSKARRIRRRARLVPLQPRRTAGSFGSDAAGGAR